MILQACQCPIVLGLKFTFAKIPQDQSRGYRCAFAARMIFNTA